MKVFYLLLFIVSMLLFNSLRMDAQALATETLSCYSVSNDDSRFVKEYNGLFYATSLQLGMLTFNVHFESLECDGADVLVKGFVYCGAYWDSTGNDVFTACNRVVPIYYCTLQEGGDPSQDIILLKRVKLAELPSKEGAFSFRFRPGDNIWLVFYFDEKISHAYPLHLVPNDK